MVSNILKWIAMGLFAICTYIINDFKSDINGKFDLFGKNMVQLNKTIGTMNDNIQNLNMTMATVVANDKAKNIQLDAHSRRFERLEREYDLRLQRIEGVYFKKDTQL